LGDKWFNGYYDDGNHDATKIEPFSFKSHQFHKTGGSCPFNADGRRVSNDLKIFNNILTCTQLIVNTSAT
jgi:hypothetical protein